MLACGRQLCQAGNRFNGRVPCRVTALPSACAGPAQLPEPRGVTLHQTRWAVGIIRDLGPARCPLAIEHGTSRSWARHPRVHLTGDMGSPRCLDSVVTRVRQFVNIQNGVQHAEHRARVEHTQELTVGSLLSQKGRPRHAKDDCCWKCCNNGTCQDSELVTI
jgi:hypothetical protein